MPIHIAELKSYQTRYIRSWPEAPKAGEERDYKVDLFIYYARV
jgi:hypothetical protein